MRPLAKVKAYLSRRRFYYRILFSFAALCICTVFLASAFSVQLLGKRYEKKILEANQNMLTQVAIYADQSLYLSMMRIINDRILNDYTQNGFSRFYFNSATMSQYDYYRCHQEVRDLYYKNELVRSITLYRHDDNYLIDSDYGLKSRPDEYVRELDAIFPFSQYLALANRSEERILFCSPESLSGSKRPNLTVLRAVPLYSSLNDAAGFLAIAFHQDVFWNEVAKIYPLGGVFFIQDDGGNVILCASHSVAGFTDMNRLALQTLQTDLSTQLVQYEGTEYAVLRVTGIDSGWHYTSLIPSATLVAESTDAKRLIFLAALLLLCGVLVLVRRISAKVYSPLHKLRNRAAGSQMAEVDDIAAIGDVLGFLEDKVDDMRKTAEQNRDVLIYKAMMEVLHGHIVSEDEIRSRFALGGVQFPLPFFCLMITDIKNNVFDSLSLQQQEYLVQRAKSFAEQWFDEPIQQIGEVQAANRIATLINLREGQYESIMHRRLELPGAVQPDLHVCVNIALSPLLPSLCQVSGAYENADKAFVYANLYEYGNVFLADEVAQWESNDWTVDWSEYQRYEGLLRAGQLYEIDSLLEDWTKHILGGGYSYQSVAAFITQLFSSTFKLGREWHLFDDRTVKECVEQEFKAAQSLAESIACIRSIASIYQAARGEKNNDGDVKLAARVMEYVRSNCRMELSLTVLADHFHVSSSHLSRLFKNVTGGNLSMFIINSKLEQAAKWLSEAPEMGIGEIAETLGYLTPAYFTRLFKQKYGMTPSQYRKQFVAGNTD